MFALENMKNVESYLFCQWRLIQISSKDKSTCALSEMENMKTSSHFKEQFILICAPDTPFVSLMAESCYSCYSYIL